MNRKVFWLGYVLAIGAVVWILWRQRQEEFEAAVQRWGERRPDISEWPVVERVQEMVTTPQKQKQPAANRGQGEQSATEDADDLKKINGIGPAFARRLNKAGIRNFRQLAALSEEEIRERMDLEPWQGDVESWIEQAQALSNRQ